MNPGRFLLLSSLILAAVSCSDNRRSAENTLALPPLAPIPALPVTLPPNTVELGDPADYEEEKLDFPMMEGPFAPTWESITATYAGLPDWLNEGKFGIWVHFGPQASGESGDWYARNMYREEKNAYANHLKNFGHPSRVGYKDVLTRWNPDKFDPSYYVKLYKEAGARFLLVQGVHHDNYDLWDSSHQPWNSVNIGPKRDLVGEWAEAIRKENLHYGITFHHEYTWWWWQTAFRSDTSGPLKGIPYDAATTTLEDGVGTPWEGYDPRMLYGIDLNEYKGMDAFEWMPENGIFTRHQAYAKWFATNWALRILDAINKYDPDFIYTDGTTLQPFCGIETGTGYKADAMQRVIASYYNQRIKRHGRVDAFSVVKFRKDAPEKTVTTVEGHIPEGIKSDQSWIGENAVGDWYYKPDIVYSSAALIRYMLEIVSRGGCYAVNIPFKADGSIDPGCETMLREIGDWMRINSPGIYGSRTWKTFGEGRDGVVKTMPGGQLGQAHADFRFTTDDFRFTAGQDGAIYAYCMTVPEPGTLLEIRSLGLESDPTLPLKSVELLGHPGKLSWTQTEHALQITCPEAMDFKTAVCFKIQR